MNKQPINLHSYYIDFEPTGVYEIDLILSAVARAGKAYHSTEFWREGEYESPEPDYPPFRGPSWQSRIQNAANDAATAWRERTDA